MESAEQFELSSEQKLAHVPNNIAPLNPKQRLEQRNYVGHPLRWILAADLEK